MAKFNDEHNDHVLFIGWYDYALTSKTMPIEAQVQQAWYIALQPTDEIRREALSRTLRRTVPQLALKASR